MALEALKSLLGNGRGGVFFLPKGASPKEIQSAAKRAKFAFFHVEGRNIERKEQLLNHVATALRFPGHFGHNWDALEECLVDMEWADADGYVIYYDHIDGLLAAHPDQFETFVEICRDAVASWKEDGTAMLVLLSGAKAPSGVAKLGAAKPAADDDPD
jgi:RNAse (barnase) inhibitor barstar